MKALWVVPLLLLTQDNRGRVEESRDGQVWHVVGYVPVTAKGVMSPALVDSQPGFVRVVFPTCPNLGSRSE